MFSYNDKIKWILKHDRNPLKALCTDKLAVKDFIKDVIGSGYTPETMCVSDNVVDLKKKIHTYDGHPSKFMVKANNDSGGTKLCDGNIDRLDLLPLEKHKNRPYGVYNGEWFYGGIKYKCFSEEFLMDNPIDYKFHCVYGDVRFCQVIKDRHIKTNEVCVDKRGVCYDFHFDVLFDLKKEFKIPDNWDDMISIAESISNFFDYVRVDMYNVFGRIYIGELTFAPRFGQYAGPGQIEAGKLLYLK